MLGGDAPLVDQPAGGLECLKRGGDAQRRQRIGRKDAVDDGDRPGRRDQRAHPRPGKAPAFCAGGASLAAPCGVQSAGLSLVRSGRAIHIFGSS